MRIRAGRLTLALIMTVQAGLAQAAPRESDPRLGVAFDRMKDFARSTETATPAEVAPPPPRPLPAPPLALVAEDGVGRGRTPAPIDTNGTGQLFLTANLWLTGKFARGYEAELRGELSSILKVVFDDDRDTSVDVVSDVIPFIEYAPYPIGRATLRFSTGLIALAENRDEFAAQVMSAVLQQNPEVYGHRDDPRLMRRLEEQIAFDRLTDAQKQIIRADLSVIERLRAADLRPWGLTDYKLREHEFLHNQLGKRWSYLLSRKWLGLRERLGGARDPMYEVRILAQKAAIAYLQDRENIRELIRTKHEFGPGLRQLRAKVRHDLRAHLKPWGPIRKYWPWEAGFVASAVPSLASFQGVRDTTYELTGHALTAIGLGQPELDALVHAWDSVARVYAHAVHAIYWVLQSLSQALVDFITAVGHWIDAFLNWIGAFLKATIGWAFLQLADFSFWVWSTLWTPLGEVHGALSLGTLGSLVLAYFNRAWIARSAKEIYYETRSLESRVRAKVSELMFSNRIRRKLESVTPRRGLAGAFEAIAAELHQIYTGAIEPGFVRGYYYRADALRLLDEYYEFPDDFWGLLHQFLRELNRDVADRNLTPDEISRILNTLDPVEIDRPSNRGLATPQQRVVEPSLALHMLESKGRRKILARTYLAIARTHPGAKRPLDALDAGKVAWKDLNETAVPESQFLGLARLVVDVERAKTNPVLAHVEAMNTLLLDRLMMFELAMEYHRAINPELTARTLDKDLPLDRATVWRELETKTRKKDVYFSSPTPPPDQWPGVETRRVWRGLNALLHGDLGRAITLRSWQHELQSSFRLWDDWSIFQKVINLPAQSFFTEYTSGLIHVQLHRLGSIREITRWVDENLVAAGANLESVTPALYHHIVTHPRLIRNEADVDALLDREYYWPQRPYAESWRVLANSWSGLRGYRSIDDSLAQALLHRKWQFPRVWRYEHTLAQRLHKILITRLREMNRLPSDYRDLKAFWTRLSDRGVTAETDRLVQQLIQMAPPGELDQLRELAIKEGRLWETELHSQLSLARVMSRPAYRRLIASRVGHPKRELWIRVVLAELQKYLPERGITYVQFLEKLSVDIDSTYEEARVISAAKGDLALSSGRTSGVDAIRTVFDEVAKWPRRDQFHFVKVLRGEAAPSERERAAFPSVGLDRVRRMFEVMPLGARVAALDTFFTHALIGQDEGAMGRTRKLARHIVGGGRSEAQRVTLQILTAFLGAVREVGNVQMTTTILAYLFALPTSAVTDPIEVLKLVLEVFGATGIKVGQFIYASQILGPDGSKLASLQSRARVPDRIEMYEDVYDLLGVPVGAPLPFEMRALLGSASMKYAFLGHDSVSDIDLVFKVFRSDAMNNVALQFDVLEHMGEHLVRKHGPRYGLLRVIIKTARQAVRREGNMRNERRRSSIARHHLYGAEASNGIAIEVPAEELLNERLLLAEFAAGTGFEELPDDVKPGFARALLETEDGLLFADADVLRFDPDRHAGNARMSTDDRALRPIDFGQLLRLSRARREKIVKLFALSQIAGRLGVNAWVYREIASLLDLNEDQRGRLRRHLKPYVKSAEGKSVPLYLSVLAALDESGFAMKDSTYIDFVRAIIQSTPFETWVGDGPTPRRTFEAKVRAEAEAYLKRFELDALQVRKIEAYNLAQTVRATILGREYKLIPKDLSRVTFDELIALEGRAKCEEPLVRAAE